MPATANVKEQMEVIGSDGVHLGTVDHMAGEDRIKLTKSDSEDGQHHYISADLIDHVDAHVHLNVTAEEAMDQWEEVDEDDDEEGEIDLEDDSSSDVDEEKIES